MPEAEEIKTTTSSPTPESVDVSDVTQKQGDAAAEEE